MQHYQMSWEDALHLVQNRRYCISPNGGFLTQIKVRTLWVIYVVIAAHFWCGQEYESIYKANYAVMSNPARTMAVSRRKRDDDDETDDPRYVSKRTLPIIFFPQYGKSTSDWNNFFVSENDRKRPIRPLNGTTNGRHHDPDAMETWWEHDDRMHISSSYILSHTHRIVHKLLFYSPLGGPQRTVTFGYRL